MLALTFTRLGCPDENGLDVGVIGVAEQDHGPASMAEVMASGVNPSYSTSAGKCAASQP